MTATSIISVSSKRRLQYAGAWLSSRMQAEEVLIVGATLDAANELVRMVARDQGAAFGWHRLSFFQLAAVIAAPLLAARGLVPLSRVGTEAIVNRLIHGLKAEGRLGRYMAVSGTRDRAEAIRVAYVAATRARDLLVVPACGDEPLGGWFEVLDPMLYPPENARRRSQRAPGCPAFGEESVLGRGPKGKPPASGSVRPGLHLPPSGGAPVVWWDPAVLALDIGEVAPLRHQRMLEADADGAAAAESQRNYMAWKTEREALLAKASEPSLSVQTVTSLVRSSATRAAGGVAEGNGLGAEPALDVERVERGGIERPGGRRFGALVHALLASINLSADATAVEAAAAVHGRIVGATREEISAAIATIGRVLKHPILRRAASAGRDRVRRETPVMLTLEDGSLVEGVIDLAFRDETSDFAGWTVVDFKTDREFEGSSDRYIAQVRVYSRAVGAATCSPSRGILLVV